MAQIHSNHYILDSKVTWTTAQEKSLSNDYPFELTEESAEQYVARVYLQFLWLPESIMPLQLLVPSLRRVHLTSTSSESNPHPLHSLLEPLLLTTRSSSKKYREELPQILDDGGGAGEIEEMMMWYALSHEKAGDDNWTRSAAPDHADRLWLDAKWRQKWLQRMERREVQIQIILHMLKLSLPGLPLSESPKKRNRLRKEPLVPTPTIEDHLEAFMDKLSTWQLMGGLVPSSISLVKDSRVDERDWIQIFCEDIVEPQFKIQLPGICSLFHSKVFPNSPFSDDDSASTASRSPSPDLFRPASDLPVQSAGSSRYASPALSATSHTSSSKPDPKALQRSRSRSLSLSLAQERERERSVSIGPSRKRVLNREVSMSRVFKPKPKPAEKPKTEVRPAKEEPLKTIKKTDLGLTLVEDTPVKPKAISGSTPQFLFQPPGDSRPPPSVTVSKTKSGGLFNDTEEEMWDINAFPRFRVKGIGQNGNVELEGFSDGEDDDAGGVHLTPSRPSNSRKRS